MSAFTSRIVSLLRGRSKLEAGPELAFRFERKWPVSLAFHYGLEQQIHLHPACFYPIYQPRWINNLYLDTHGLAHYHAHVQGQAARHKIRIRWYGEYEEGAKHARIEIKWKRAQANAKETYTLPGFEVGLVHRPAELQACIAAAGLPDYLQHHCRDLQPVLLNRYHRSYFRSACGPFRLTLDRQLGFGLPAASPAFLPADQLILELKYAAHTSGAEAVSRHFPFRMYRYSKYVMGVQALYD